jgi:F420-non-reducing hydrogenase iron-sulfur subunit
MSDAKHDPNFEPKIVGFLCNWCSYRAADLAGSARIAHAPNIRIIRVMCSGRVDPTFVFQALALGADGVMIAGCHPGECHYIEQNYKAMRRFHMLRHTLRAMGVEDERVQLVWASAAEGQQLAEAIDRMVDEVRALGPLRWSQNWAENGERLKALEEIVKEHAEAMEVPV